MQKPPRGTPLNRTHPLARNLVGCWVMNEGTGHLVCDVSGHGNHGTLTNMDSSDWVASTHGPALDFDAANDVVLCSSGPALSDLFSGGGSIVVLLGPRTGGAANQGRIVCKGNFWTAWALYTANATELRFRVHFTINDGLWTAMTVSAGWSHFALTYDSDSVANSPSAYVDGRAVPPLESWAPAGTYVSDTAQALAMGNQPSALRGYDGQIALVYLYDRVLAPPEIAWLHREPFAIFGYPVAVWPLPELEVLGPPAFRNRTERLVFANNTERLTFRDCTPRVEFATRVS